MGVATRTFQAQLFGSKDGETGIDDDFAARASTMLVPGLWQKYVGPVRGPWPDESWRGWWGENPVYHTQVFVLTKHPRAPLVMEGGTTFHFVTDGIRGALERARDAANGKDVRIGGGAATIRQYLQERLIDELHIAIAPVLLGAGERLFEGVNIADLGYTCTSMSIAASNSHRANRT